MTWTGVAGVRAVFTGSDIPAVELAAALESARGPCVVLVDDAELLRECDAADVLRSVMRSGDDRPQGLVIAGGADDICTGFSGWQIDVKKSRQGALLSPQGTTDGDLIGVRLPRSIVGGPVVPGPRAAAPRRHGAAHRAGAAYRCLRGDRWLTKRSVVSQVERASSTGSTTAGTRGISAGGEKDDRGGEGGGGPPGEATGRLLASAVSAEEDRDSEQRLDQ